MHTGHRMHSTRGRVNLNMFLVRKQVHNAWATQKRTSRDKGHSRVYSKTNLNISIRVYSDWIRQRQIDSVAIV